MKQVIEYRELRGLDGGKLIPFVTFCCVRYNVSPLQRLEHSSCHVAIRDQTYEPSDA